MEAYSLLYQFVRGPLFVIAIVVFLGGLIYQIRRLILAGKKDGAFYPFFNWRYSLRSIYHWLLPYGSRSMRVHFFTTLASVFFHICLFLIPVFLFAHNLLWYESYRISWWTFSEKAGDVLAVIAMAAWVFLLLRRLLRPLPSYVQTVSDYLLLGGVILPFVTGFLAYHQWLLPYKLTVILHMLSAEVVLMALPFTRLLHMVYFFFTRAYMGSEFGFRGTQDW
uniref:Nitrate reductase n=1 Tax=Ammonifex degensii TaxID=42838 RepID=A0A7C1JBP9_9THEO